MCRGVRVIHTTARGAAGSSEKYSRSIQSERDKTETFNLNRRVAEKDNSIKVEVLLFETIDEAVES